MVSYCFHKLVILTSFPSGTFGSLTPELVYTNLVALSLESSNKTGISN